jgi:glycerol-3-phosphate dehydrogenase
MNREEMLRRLEEGSEWDVLVVGGGATGLGVAVDAATRGYRVLLLEQADFASATSSRSTKLVHGGVRYLEQGDLRLVMEALHERGLLHANAPHVARNLPFIVPRYKWWEAPFYGVGLKTYDLLAGRLNLAPSRILDREETIARIPNVETRDLLGGVMYFDGQFDDARMAVTLAQSAVDQGACLLNYARVTGLVHSGGTIAGAEVEDLESGTRHEVSAKVVVNAAGIFADAVRRLDDPAAAAAVQPSQGVHLVFDGAFLAGKTAIMVPHTDDGRVLFVIPWHGRALVGTTDTAMPQPEMEPRPLPDEIEFILRNAGRYLGRDPSRKDVLCAFAGQRPLVRVPGKTATKELSRSHEVLISSAGLVTIVGGKWTTYRRMAQDTMDHAIEVGGLPLRPCATETLRLHGWKPSSPESPEDPMRLYGTDLEGLESLEAERPDLREALHPALPYRRSTIVWAARHEMARTLEDVLARRTRSLLLDVKASVDAAPEAALLLARELGRDAAWAETQVEAYHRLADGYLVPSPSAGRPGRA